MKKKFIAMFLVLVMAVCAFPVSAFADAPSTNTVEPRAIKILIIAEDRTFVSLRRAPGTSTEVIGYVQGGDIFDPIYDQGDWSNPTYVTGTIDGHRWAHGTMRSGDWYGTDGYVANEFLETVTRP